MMNNIKSVIQKEEYIALAVNKYILQNLSIPKKLNTTTSVTELDWEKMLDDEYLGGNFSKYNPLLKSDIVAIFDSNNNLFIKGSASLDSEYNEKYNYLYNFYINKIFRVNTTPPVDITKTNLLIGSKVIYSTLQEKIVQLLNDGKLIYSSSQSCTVGKYFYELKDNSLVQKYCKSSNESFEIYQDSPIYLEDSDDLTYIKSSIGARAYVKKNGFWYEYYYQGDSSNPWMPTGSGSILTTTTNETSIEDRVLSYIPDSKDLLIKEAGGCMLANGDIFCWGDNSYKKVGIETYGQIDTTLSPDFVNTPVMLKVQINDTQRKSERWYNNPFRIKFEKMAMNQKNVCGLSPIYEILGTNEKYGGDLYCNGEITSTFYENIDANKSSSSILSRNKFFTWGKSDLEDNDPKTINVSDDGGAATYTNSVEDTTIRDEIYLKDIAMTADNMAVLSDDGKIYTIGKNYNGLLGIGSDDKFLTEYEPVKVQVDDGVYFDKIFVLRDKSTFGAIDSNKNFWIWGERDSTSYTKPTRLNDGNKQFNPDFIFVNSSEFLLQDISSNVFYRTSGDDDIEAISTSDIPTTAVSATIIEENDEWKYLYVDKDLKLYGTDSLLSCRTKVDNLCTNLVNKAIFEYSLNKLNTDSNFLNVSTYKLDATVQEISEDFEDNWNRLQTDSAGDVTTVFMGRYANGSSNTNYLTKTYDFGTSYANRNVSISFNFYEIDSWDGEYFRVYVNDELKHQKQYWASSIEDGVKLSPIFSGWDDEKHNISITGRTDSQGKLKLSFSSTIDQDVSDKSWGIDNIEIKYYSTRLSYEDFESNELDGWTLKEYSDNAFTNMTSQMSAKTTSSSESVSADSETRVDPTIVLGRYRIGYQSLEKTYDFGSSYANSEIVFEFDFFEIDSWDMERFQVILNDVIYAEDGFIHDNHPEWSDTNDTGIYTLNLGSDYAYGKSYNDEKYHYKIKAKLDKDGKLAVKFRVRELKSGEYGDNSYDYGQSLDDESWAVDNIHIKVKDSNKHFTCGITGISTESQMYCWGIVGRSLPILSTSLYNMSKINSLNKLFISTNDDESNQMSYDLYDVNGSLFLKFPTYIGGFDYPFYFK